MHVTCVGVGVYIVYSGAGPGTRVCMEGFYFPRDCGISFNIVCVRVCVWVPRLAPTPPRLLLLYFF